MHIVRSRCPSLTADFGIEVQVLTFFHCCSCLRDGQEKNWAPKQFDQQLAFPGNGVAAFFRPSITHRRELQSWAKKFRQLQAYIPTFVSWCRHLKKCQHHGRSPFMSRSPKFCLLKILHLQALAHPKILEIFVRAFQMYIRCFMVEL